MDKAKHNADLVAILRQLKTKGDQMEVIKVLNGLQALDRIPGYEVLDYVKGFVQVKQDDPAFSFADYMEMAQMGSQQTMKGIMAKPAPKAAKPAQEHVTINKADLKSVSIQLGFSQMMPPLDEMVQQPDIKNAKTIEVPPPEPPKKITMTGTVTKHLTSQFRYSPTSNKDMGGGMGSVIPYQDKALDREVIRKKPKTKDEEGNSLSLEQLADDLAVFEREMRISGTLVHANIPPVYEAGIDRKDGVPYFDMLKIVGKPLNDVIEVVQKDRRKTAEAKEYTLQRRVQIFADIARAMAYAHTKKIIHRDLKPGNVMIGDNKVTYVIDWGLAKHLDDKEDEKLGGRAKSQKELVNKAVKKEEMYKTQEEGTIKGTLSYMSPEQARADPIDEKSDQYTLGTILYELATLEDFRPFLAKTQLEKVIMIGKGTYPFTAPRKMRPETPAELESIILKATQFDKRKRYPSVQHMLNDVEAYLTGGYVSAHDYGFVETFAKRVRNNPIRTVAGGLAAIALAGIVSVYGVMSGRVAKNQVIAAEAEAGKAKIETEKAKAVAKQNESEAKLAQTLRNKLEQEHSRSRAREKYWEGELILKTGGNPDKAIAKFDEAGAEDNTWNDPHYGKGLAYYEKRERELALKEFETSNKISKENSGRVDVRALFYAAMTVIDQYDRPKDATPYLEELVEKSEKKDEPYVLLGKSILDFNNGNYNEMFSLLDKVVQEQKMWEAFYLRALGKSQGIAHAFNNKGLKEFRDYKSAVEDMTKAIEADPSKWRPVHLRCLLYNVTQEFDLAMKDAEKLFEMKVKSPLKYAAKARTLLNMHRDQEALEVLAQAETEFNSLDAECIRTRGLAFFNTGKYDKAESDLTKVIEKYQEAPDYSYRGLARMELQKFTGALDDFNKAISINPFPNSYVYRGICHERMKDPNAALEDYRTGIEKGSALGYYYRGKLFAANDKKSEAINDFENYLKSNDRQKRAEVEILLDQLKKSKSQ